MSRTGVENCAVTYRIAVGQHWGRKVFTLQTLPPDEDSPGGAPPGGSDRVAKEAGFSLHAGVSSEAHPRDKLERLCRYVSRPAVSEKRLAISSHGNIRYPLKKPYRDGTTHAIFEPLDFIAKLAALVPKPQVNPTRFRGVFAPNRTFRVRVTPAERGRGRKPRQPTGENWLDKTPAERHASMTWMQRFKRVFNWAASGSIRRRPHRDLRAVCRACQDHCRCAKKAQLKVAPQKFRRVLLDPVGETVLGDGGDDLGCAGVALAFRHNARRLGIESIDHITLSVRS